MGHEAIAVAVSETMQAGDSLLPTHRNIAYNLARAGGAVGAGALKLIVDEYLMKPTGLNGGRSGSMNLLNPERGIVYTSSILGNQCAVATGLAMADKIAGKKNVTIVMVGDGSMEEGIFYESMLQARSMDLPVIFLVENNEWSMSTRIDQRRSPIDISLFAESLDVRYVKLEGNDVFQYADILQQLREFALAQSAPVCIEVSVSTLGERMFPPTAEFPDGEYVNYHAGPTPTINLNEWPIIKESDEDPVFVLAKNVDKAELEKDAREQFAALQKEIA
jgi:TPP-dependent pyruvate/acetoin dehydrogenase alpha subunit